MNTSSEEFQQYMQSVIERTYKYPQPDYYSKRKHGKYTIYNKDGMRVAWGLNEKEMKNYMKLLKKEERWGYSTSTYLSRTYDCEKQAMVNGRLCG